MIETAAVADLLGRWWLGYDEGHFDALGRQAIMAWQTQHRLDSPYPLRHMGINVHVTGRSGADETFSSYLFVTHIVAGRVTNLSTGIVTGSARLDAGVVRLSGLHVVLDTQTSVPFRER